MTDLTGRLAAFIERQQPSVYCCACLARDLEADEARVRDTVQTLVIGPQRRFALARRPCVGCDDDTDPVVVFVGRE